MKSASAGIDIAAPPDTVWAIITSTASHPSFDPSCVRIIGNRPALDARLSLYATYGREKPLRFRITAFAPPRLMVWTAAAPFGLARRARTFGIDETARGQVRFTLKEEVTGPLRRLVRFPLAEIEEAFAGFCRGLKELAEA